MDYFLPEEKSYMKYLPGEFPIHLKTWSYCVRGTGDEPQSWTCGHDAANAIAELLAAPEWVLTSFVYLTFIAIGSLLTKVYQEQVTYVTGEFGSFNKAAKVMESFYGINPSFDPFFCHPEDFLILDQAVHLLGLIVQQRISGHP